MSNNNMLDNNDLANLEETLKLSLSLESASASDDDFEDDFEDITESSEAKELMSKLNKGSKVSKNTKASNKSKGTMYKKEVPKKDTGELPAWHLGRLEKSADLEVFVPYHEIPYKGQRWPVRERNMIYKLELVTKQKENIDCFNALHDGVEQYKEKLRKGLIRYYKIITYESIPSNQKELGMVEIYENGRYKIHLKYKLLAEMRIYDDGLEKDISNVLKKLVRVNKDKLQAYNNK